MMPPTKSAAISNAVAIGRRMKGSEMLIAESRPWVPDGPVVIPVLPTPSAPISGSRAFI